VHHVDGPEEALMAVAQEPFQMRGGDLIRVLESLTTGSLQLRSGGDVLEELCIRILDVPMAVSQRQEEGEGDREEEAHSAEVAEECSKILLKIFLHFSRETFVLSLPTYKSMMRWTMPFRSLRHRQTIKLR
jgi:hypothetical protein